jgi:hypothetical protein
MPQAVITALVLLEIILPFPALAVDCNTSSFSVLAASPAVVPCLQRTNIAVTTVQTTLSPEQLTKVCTTPPCRTLLTALIELRLAECTIPFGSRPRLQADLLQPTIIYCAKVDASISTQSGSHGSFYGDMSHSANASVSGTQPKNDTPGSQQPRNRAAPPTAATIALGILVFACMMLLAVEM